MSRTITVRGTGNISVKPDLVEVTMTLRTLDPDYDTSMGRADEMMEHLREALAKAGFRKKDLKTTNYQVRTEHESVRDEKGNYKSVFVGYACVYGLKLEFGFDTARLSRVLTAISGCLADPDLNIQFTVRDREAVSAALLKDAAANAREKAEIIAAASGVALGKLLAAEYNLGEPNLRSATGFSMDAACLAKANSRGAAVVPEDIRISDSVTFQWEIE